MTDRNPLARYPTDAYDPADAGRYAMVRRCLHEEGDLYGTLTPEQHHGARMLADGCGATAHDDEALWTWEHVSHSSAAGMLRVHDFLLVEGLID